MICMPSVIGTTWTSSRRIFKFILVEKKTEIAEKINQLLTSNQVRDGMEEMRTSVEHKNFAEPC